MKKIALIVALALGLIGPALAQSTSPPLNISGGKGSGGSGVPSIAGTANQINESGSPGATTLSLSSTIVAPGTVTIPSGDLILNGSGSGSSTLNAPATGGGTNALPPGNVGVVGGPASAVAGHVATFGDTTGQIIQDGGALTAGTVTSVGSGACLTGGPITSTGTLSGNFVINPQTNTTYTVLSSDACKLVTFSNGSAIAVTLPQATGSFAAGYSFDVENLGGGLVTITPTTSTINGAATLTIPTNTGCSIVSDGVNYQVSACTPAAGLTGTGAFVRATSPTLVTPTLGAALATSVNGVTIPVTTDTVGLLGTAQNWTAQQSNCVKALTVSTTTFTPDGTCNNYSFTLVTACSTACTIANPSATPVAGTSGVMAITQFSSAKTLTWGSQYYAAGGSATVQPDATINGLNYISYYVADSTHIVITAAAVNATH